MQERGTAGADRRAPSLFHEVQHFRMWMFWVPITVVTALVWYEFYQQIIRSNPQGTHPIPNGAAWVLTIVFGLGLPALGLTLRLMTEVVPGELRMRVFPFRPTRIPLKEVAEAEVRQYSGQREYGGWGVRTSRRSGKAYTAYGDKGVQLWLRDGDRILIGSQRADDLASALRQAGVSVR